MKVQNIRQNTNNNKNTTPTFNGGADIFLGYLATNKALGMNLVDFCFMVAPRSTSDFIGRGSDAGWETLRRESMGATNNTLIGVYGMLAGALVSGAINKLYGMKNANKILISPEMLKLLSTYKLNQLKNNKTELDYIKEVLKNVKAYNPSAKGADKDGFVKLSDEAIEEIAKLLEDSLNNKDLDTFRKWEKLKKGNSYRVISNKITEYTGAQSKYIVKASDNTEVATDLHTLLEDFFNMSKTFNKDEVKREFQKQIDSGKDLQDNKFFKDFNKYLRKKSIFGFMIAAAIGLSAQPINMYLTKLKTGSDGFVGVEGRTKDDSPGFWGLKFATAITFLSVVIKHTGCKLSELKTLPRQFMDKMAFKGFWASVNQLKGIYGLTIFSRLLAARDKDELRESLTKDSLGYFSWIVLGDIINKMVAEGSEKSVLNRTNDVEKKGFLSRAFNSSLKNREEILIETMHQNNISTVKQEDGKNVAKSFKEIMKDIDKLPEAAKTQLKKRLRTLNRAQIAGYLFSGLVLGLGIPNLNMFITNKLDEKRKQKALNAQK